MSIDLLNRYCVAGCIFPNFIGNKCQKKVQNTSIPAEHWCGISKNNDSESRWCIDWKIGEEYRWASTTPPKIVSPSLARSQNREIKMRQKFNNYKKINIDAILWIFMTHIWRYLFYYSDIYFFYDTQINLTTFPRVIQLNIKTKSNYSYYYKNLNKFNHMM